MAEKKDKLMKEYLDADIKVGDWLETTECKVRRYCDDNHKNDKVKVEVLEVLDDGKVKVSLIRDSREKLVLDISDCEKNTFKIGMNPFSEDNWHRMMETGNYNLESIMHKCAILAYDDNLPLSEYKIGGIVVPELNWNPYIFNKDGEKEYYQRDFCWSLKDEQLFIESIYQRINCGLVIVRKRSWGWLEKQIANGNDEVAFNDIVDGKQRMHTIDRFVNNKFQDLHGNYFSDLSTQAQYQFYDSNSLQFAVFHEDVTDEMIVKAFLNVNFTGVPMSQEHIDYVKEIQKKI